MLVLHISDVSWPDIAIDHEHNEIRKILGHLNAFDQSVKGADLFSGSTEYEIFSRLFDANAATSLDWQKYSQDKFGFTISKSEKRKIIHVHDGIKDLEKASGLPLWEAYSTLSEFVHPNVGSKMLIVNTKHEHDQYMDAITLGENKSNSEAALFFIDNMAESMFYTMTLALTLSDRGQKIIALLDNMSKAEDSKIVH